MNVYNSNKLLPLSAIYKYDDTFFINGNVIESYDGYLFVYQPIFKNSKDIIFNKETVFYLSSSYSLFDFIKDQIIKFPKVGTYLTLSLNNMYFVNINNFLYLSSIPLNKNSFFKVIYNNDGTFSFLNGENYYITVESELPYNLYMAPKMDVNNFQYQKFNISSFNGQHVAISTFFKDKYNPLEKIQRFWSYSKTTNQARAIGVIKDDDYTIENKYLIYVGEFIAGLEMSGLLKDQTWIKYYNLLSNRINNKNVKIFQEYEKIKLNRLISSPYYKDIEFKNLPIAKIKIDIANLKNFMTPFYEYNIKNE